MKRVFSVLVVFFLWGFWFFVCCEEPFLSFITETDLLKEEKEKEKEREREGEEEEREEEERFNYTNCPKEGKRERIAVLICDPRVTKKADEEAILDVLLAMDRSHFQEMDFYYLHGSKLEPHKKEEFLRVVKHIKFTNLTKINVHFFQIEANKNKLYSYQYSNLFKNPTLWKNLAKQLCPRTSHILVTQYDVRYSKSPLAPILPDFFRYDYIGGGVNSTGFPFNCYNNSVTEANICCCIGGISLRSLRATLLALTTFPPRKMKTHHPKTTDFEDNHEDLYFYGSIAKIGGEMPVDLFSLRFGEEDYFSECGVPPFGYHRLSLPRRKPHEEGVGSCKKKIAALKEKWERRRNKIRRRMLNETEHKEQKRKYKDIREEKKRELDGLRERRENKLTRRIRSPVFQKSESEERRENEEFKIPRMPRRSFINFNLIRDRDQNNKNVHFILSSFIFIQN